MELFSTYVSPKALDLVGGVLASTFLSEGKLVRRFEEGLTAGLGLRHPVAVNSGTSALHLALDVAGVGPGDEVILPAQTFIATGLAVLMQQASPVFADVDARTGNISPESVRAKITPRTRAILPVHWAGYPCDLDELAALAREFGDIAIVEDAAHALGATYKGVPIGAVSRFTCFSFQAIKHLTTGDGGALCCREERDVSLAMRRRWFGIDRATDLPGPLGERLYDLDHVGYKYHLNDYAAALGLANLEGLRARLDRRTAIAKRLTAELAGVVGLELPPYASDRQSAWWLFPVLVDRREDFVGAMASRGVPASVVHQRIDRNKVFGGVRPELTGQAAFDARQIALPCHEGLTDDDIANVVRAAHSGW
jgi:perosamine synthetase